MRSSAQLARAAWVKCTAPPIRVSDAAVALKSLREAFARDVDRMVRFACKAKVLAYGLEESNDRFHLHTQRENGAPLRTREILHEFSEFSLIRLSDHPG